jgi:hypothetical protein
MPLLFDCRFVVASDATPTAVAVFVAITIVVVLVVVFVDVVSSRQLHDGAKNRLFFRWERAKAEARYTPRLRDRTCRACREGSCEGGGSLVGADDGLLPCGGDTRCQLQHRGGGKMAVQVDFCG